MDLLVDIFQTIDWGLFLLGETIRPTAACGGTLTNLTLVSVPRPFGVAHEEQRKEKETPLTLHLSLSLLKQFHKMMNLLRKTRHDKMIQ